MSYITINNTIKPQHKFFNYFWILKYYCLGEPYGKKVSKLSPMI